jgi:hypothetical protein
MLVWCWYGAFRFSHVRILVFLEVLYSDISHFVNRVTDDEPNLHQSVKKSVNVYIVAREQIDLQLLRPVLKTPGTIGRAP